MKAKGHSFNNQLLSNRDFHVPCIEKKLLDYAGLVDMGSNMDPRDFDPFYLPPDVDYEKLAKDQRETWESENKHSQPQAQQQSLQEKKKTILLERMYNSTKDNK